MMKPDDVSARARNFYREEDYFSLNVRNGVIRNPTGVRMVAIPEEFVAGLHAGLEDETGAAAGVVLYQCGKWWGKRFAKAQAIEVRHFYNLEAAELPLHFYQQVLRKVWGLYGWGLLDISHEAREKGFIVVDVQNAMYSDVVGNIGRTTDHVIAGALASIIGELAGRPLECVEIACKSKGDPKCTFLVGVKSRIDVAQAWVKQGRTRASVLEAIAGGELV